MGWPWALRISSSISLSIRWPIAGDLESIHCRNCSSSRFSSLVSITVLLGARLVKLFQVGPTEWAVIEHRSGIALAPLAFRSHEHAGSPALARFDVHDLERVKASTLAIDSGQTFLERLAAELALS